MSLKRALRAVLDDPTWPKKVGLAFLGMLVPYVGAIVVVGYGIEYMRKVAWTQDQTLPEWRDLERYLKTGFKAFVVMLVYSLPISLVVGVIIAAAVLLGVAMDSPGLMTALIVLSTLVTLPVTLAIGAFSQAGVVRFGAYDVIPEGFKLKEIWESLKQTRRDFWGALWRAWLIGFALSAVILLGYGVVMAGLSAGALTGSEAGFLAGLGFMYCGQFVLMLFTMAASAMVQLVSYNLWGQYLAVAYPEPRFVSVTAPDPVARYGAGHDVLPVAPGQAATPAAPVVPAPAPEDVPPAPEA